MSDDRPEHDPDRPDGGPPTDLDRELEALLSERRAANPRKTPDREPVGAESTRKLIAMTVVAIVLSTFVLVGVLLVG
jgi:hypothetical protein